MHATPPKVTQIPRSCNAWAVTQPEWFGFGSVAQKLALEDYIFSSDFGSANPKLDPSENRMSRKIPSPEKSRPEVGPADALQDPNWMHYRIQIGIKLDRDP